MNIWLSMYVGGVIVVAIMVVIKALGRVPFGDFCFALVVLSVLWPVVAVLTIAQRIDEWRVQ